MASRDSEYLENRLKQLKTSVRNNQAGLGSGDLSRAVPAPSSQRNVPVYDERDVIYSQFRPPNRVTFQGPSDANVSGHIAGSPLPAAKAYTNGVFASKLQGSMAPSVVIETKRPRSTQVIETLKVSDANFNGVRGYPTPGFAMNATGSGIINPMEPRVKVVHASNSKSFVQNDGAPFDYRASNFQTPPVTIGTDYSFRNAPTLLRQTDYVPAAFGSSQVNAHPVYYPSERVVRVEGDEPDLLSNLNQASFIEKHEGKVLNELQNKLSNQISRNNKLAEDIANLRRQSEVERNRLQTLADQLKQELRHSRATEAETSASLSTRDSHLGEVESGIGQHNDRFGQMRTELERIQVENDMLRGELKRLGEITAEKILDLENNINSVARMKEFETEKFVMEKDKANNSADFVVEQMKVHFNERSAKIDEQMRKTQQELDKLNAELKTLTDELRGFNANANLKIDSVMNVVIQEEQERHQTEVRDIETKLAAEEEEIGRLNRRNTEIISKLQATERDGKNRLMARKNENTRLKEDLSSFEQNYNKLLIQVSNENREYEKKKEMVELAKEDYDEVHNKSHMLDQRYEEEMQNIQAGQEETLHELEAQLAALRDRENRIQHEIRAEQDRIAALNKRRNDLIEDVQRNFNATLQSQFAGVAK